MEETKREADANCEEGIKNKKVDTITVYLCVIPKPVEIMYTPLCSLSLSMFC